MSAAVGVGSALQLQSKAPSGRSHQPQAVPLCWFGKRSSRSYAVRRWFGVNVVAESKPFFGAPVRRSASERLHLWRSDGPGRDPKLRFVVRPALSQVPEKPLGLYDPSYDKDSCGVGFVAELSGQSSRKTVRIELNSIEFFRRLRNLFLSFFVVRKCELFC